MAWPAVHKQVIWARTPAPAWVDAVRSLPSNVLVMSDQPPAISWARRHSMVLPVDERSDLLTILRMYRPGYYLDLRTVPALTIWTTDELEPVASGAE
jgi:hypothetical protein